MYFAQFVRLSFNAKSVVDHSVTVSPYQLEYRFQHSIKSQFVLHIIVFCIGKLSIITFLTQKFQNPSRCVARIWKRGGLFWKSETTASDLDPNFHCSWIRITRFIRNWDVFFDQNRKFKQFFSQKTGDLQKKRSSPKLRRFFSAKIGMSNGFSGRITATTSQLRHPNSFGEGLFSFFQQKSASEAPKKCGFAYFTG